MGQELDFDAHRQLGGQPYDSIVIAARGYYLSLAHMAAQWLEPSGLPVEVSDTDALKNREGWQDKLLILVGNRSTRQGDNQVAVEALVHGGRVALLSCCLDRLRGDWRIHIARSPYTQIDILRGTPFLMLLGEALAKTGS